MQFNFEITETIFIVMIFMVLIDIIGIMATKNYPEWRTFFISKLILTLLVKIIVIGFWIRKKVV